MPSESPFLSTLPATVASNKEASQGEPTIRFTNVKELLQAINRISGDYLIVTGIEKSILSKYYILIIRCLTY